VPSPQEAIAALEEARAGTLALIAGLSEEDLERVHSPIMSPLVWDLGHIAAYEDLWLAHRHGGTRAAAP
jgi:iron(II)-dependent oxidoreductase